MKNFSISEFQETLLEKLTSNQPWILGRIGGSDFEAVAYKNLASRSLLQNLRRIADSRGFGLVHEHRCRQLNGYFGKFSPRNYSEYLDILHKSWTSSPSLSYAGLPVIEHFDLGRRRWFSEYVDEITANKDVVSYSLIEEVYPFLEVFSKAARGARILVVSPFSKTVRHQIERNASLVRNFSYPEFELLTLDVPVTYSSFSKKQPIEGTWEASLGRLSRATQDLKFDFALVSAGSYSMPLLSHIMKSGGRGVYIGGMLNVFFNISGRRFDHPNYFRFSEPSTRIEPFEASSIRRQVRAGRTRDLEALRAYLPDENQ